MLRRLGSEVLLPLPDGDAYVRLAAVDRQVPAALGQVDERADVALLEPVGLHRLAAGLDQLVDGEGQLAPAHDVRRVDQALDVVAQAEDGGTADGAVAANPLEGADAVVQRRRQEVQLRLAERDELAVHPDRL